MNREDYRQVKKSFKPRLPLRCKAGIVHRDLKPENIFVSASEMRQNLMRTILAWRA